MTEILDVAEGYLDIDAEDFLDLVWGEQEAWIDLPAKVGKYWVPLYTKWPNDAAVTRRIDSSLRDREDLYYSVARFAQRGRKIENVLPTGWLWADLDEVHPTAGAKLGFLPTVAVESSPGRYQALWRLTRPLVPRVLEKLNRALSYALDADRGGWDLTQVLRLPGTRNFKYPEAPVVRVMWIKSELTYDPGKVWEAVREYAAPAMVGAGALGKNGGTKSIGGKARALLGTGPENVVEGERSARLWELECLLAEAGLGEEEIFGLVRVTPWNKWRGMGEGGRRRLRGDIRKAIGHVARQRALKQREPEPEPGKERSEGADGALPWVGYSTFMAMTMEEPKWLIEHIWTADSHGFIAGEPKTNKTTIALALALSVASGQPFLGRYEVGVTGPVLMVQEENAPWMMQDRLRKLAAFYGLISSQKAHIRQAGAGALGSVSVDLDFPTDVPLRLLNNYGFDLGIEEHREMLEAEVRELRPKLVVLDPMYLIIPADGNSADALRPFLQWIIQLRYRYETAVAVVHHLRKESLNGGVVRVGQRILGSTILHGFSDSAIYTSAMDEDREGWVKCRLETEFRSMAPQKPIEVGLSLGNPGGLMMNCDLAERTVEDVIRGMVRDEPGITVRQLAAALRVDRRTVLARIRGGEHGGMRIEGSGKGKGNAQRVYLESKGEEGDNDSGEEGRD